jgi:hypothetical protein
MLMLLPGLPYDEARCLRASVSGSSSGYDPGLCAADLPAI